MPVARRMSYSFSALFFLQLTSEDAIALFISAKVEGRFATQGVAMPPNTDSAASSLVLPLNRSGNNFCSRGILNSPAPARPAPVTRLPTRV